MTEMQSLQLLLDELESSQLHVILAPLNPNQRGWNESGCKRVVANRNAAWYRSFCGRHLSSRKRNHKKADTKIKRQNVLTALRRLLRGETSKFEKYDAELLRLARGRMG